MLCLFSFKCADGGLLSPALGFVLTIEWVVSVVIRVVVVDEIGGEDGGDDSFDSFVVFTSWLPLLTLLLFTLGMSSLDVDGGVSLDLSDPEMLVFPSGVSFSLVMFIFL